MDRYCPKHPMVVGLPSLFLHISAALALGMRLLSRKMAGAGMWWDDILPLPALVSLECSTRGQL